MNILLPDYDCVIEEGIAEIKNRKLYLYKNGVFKEVMYKITYMLYGDDECYYCHRKRRASPEQKDKKKYFSTISMDHVIPKNFGGLTIPDNMKPACTDCNSRKGNMFEDEYREYMKILEETAGQGKSGRAIRRLFKESLQYKQELRRYGHIPCLPEKWLCKEDLKCILVTFWLSQNKGGSYEQMIGDVKKYNNLLYAITVTANGYLVDGFNANLVATLYDLPIKVVKLDNVIFLGFPSGGE